MEQTHVFDAQNELKALRESCLILTSFDDDPPHQIVALLVDGLADITQSAIVINNVVNYLAEVHGLDQFKATNILNASAQLLSKMVLEFTALQFNNVKAVYLVNTYPWIAVNIIF